MIAEKQCTIVWHVYDLKTSYVLDHFINLLNLEFGKSLTKITAKKHDYLGMLLDFSIPSMVKIAIK